LIPSTLKRIRPGRVKLILLVFSLAALFVWAMAAGGSALVGHTKVKLNSGHSSGTRAAAEVSPDPSASPEPSESPKPAESPKAAPAADPTDPADEQDEANDTDDGDVNDVDDAQVGDVNDAGTASPEPEHSSKAEPSPPSGHDDPGHSGGPGTEHGH
jgi:cytoskeletal protein RodZ